MTEQEFKDWRKDCGLSRAEAAKFLGIKVGTIDSYQLGRRPIPKPIIRACASHPIDRRARLRAYIDAQLPPSMSDAELSSAFVGEVLLGFVALI